MKTENRRKLANMAKMFSEANALHRYLARELEAILADELGNIDHGLTDAEVEMLKRHDYISAIKSVRARSMEKSPDGKMMVESKALVEKAGDMLGFRVDGRWVGPA